MVNECDTGSEDPVGTRNREEKNMKNTKKKHEIELMYQYIM